MFVRSGTLSTSMRIRHKIFIGYMALIAVSVVLVVIFLITLSNINKSYDDLLNRDLQVFLQAGDLRTSVQKEAATMRMIQQMGDGPDLLVDFEVSLKQQEQVVQSIRPLLHEQSDFQALDHLNSDRAAYAQLARQLIDMYRTKQSASAISTFLSEKYEPARLQVIELCDNFVDAQSSEVAVSKAMLSSNLSEISSRLLLGTIIGILSALLAATLLTEGLTSPLRRLMRNIQSISSGDLKTAVTVRSHDEVGELAAVLETMRQRLEAAAAQNEALLQSAREEAEKLAETRGELEGANAELAAALATESEARQRFEQINKLKDEFAGMVTHELKTPVSYVYNYASALREHNASLNDGQRHEFLTAIQSEALHLLTLIDDIMAISLFESGVLRHRFVETDLRKLTDSVVKDQQITTRRHSMTIKGPKALPVKADPTRLRQVLNNLLSNAIKYSPQGGNIEVRLRANPGDGTATVYVRDYGIGIRPEDVPKLFDRFSRIQRRETMAIPGSGLGLYIAHHIIKAHGGTLLLEPAPGKGTIAQISVPLMPGATINIDYSEETEQTGPLMLVPAGDGQGGDADLLAISTAPPEQA